MLGLYCRDRPAPDEDQLLWTPPKWDLGEDDEASADEEILFSQNDSVSSDGNAPGDPSDAGIADHYDDGLDEDGLDEPTRCDQDRMVEEALAARDARRGFRHTVAELFPDTRGRPSRPGRQPWKAPRGGTV